MTCRPVLAGGSHGRDQSAQVFEADLVVAAPQHVAALLLAGTILGNQGLDAEPKALRSFRPWLIVRTSCSSVICTFGALPLAAAPIRRCVAARLGFRPAGLA